MAGWVAEHNLPVFLPDGALTDPASKVVPEAEEEKYQSLVAVPLNDKPAWVIGVIALHAEAPREFTRDDSDFVIHAASLVAGAIENARLYQVTRRRLALAEGLADLARAVAAAATLDELLPAVAKRAHRLLSVDACQLHVIDPSGRREMLCTAWPPEAAPPNRLTAEELGVEIAKRSSGRRLAGTLWVPTPRAPRWCSRWSRPTSWSGSSRCGCPAVAGWTPRNARSRPRSLVRPLLRSRRPS